MDNQNPIILQLAFIKIYFTLKTMTYFNLPCFAPQTTKKLLLLSSILLILTGLMDWGYTAVQVEQVNSYTKFAQSTGSSSVVQLAEQNKKMLDPLVIYFAVAGFVDVVSSVIILLVLLDVLAKSGRAFWVNVLLVLSFSNFAFNFAIAIYSSVTATFWNYKYKDLLDPNYALTGDYITNTRVMIRYCTAEAIVTFVLNLPLAGLVILALLNKSLRQESDSGAQGQHNRTTDQLKKVHPS